MDAEAMNVKGAPMQLMKGDAKCAKRAAKEAKKDAPMKLKTLKKLMKATKARHNLIVKK